MARYQLMAEHHLDGEHRRMGEIVEYDGTPSRLMKPLDKAATAASNAVLADVPPEERTRLMARWGRAASGKREPAGYS